MRIMTVRQPWAWAIINGGKDVENRVRNIAGSYRGPVAIHAGLAFDDESWDAPMMGPLMQNLLFEHAEVEFHPGVILGVVDLDAAHSAQNCRGRTVVEELSASLVRGYRHPTCSPWAARDGWHLELRNPRPLNEPIPYKGALGLRTLPDDVAAAVLAGVSS